METLPRTDLVRAEPVGIEIRESKDGTPLLVGRFAAYNEWTEIDSAWEGHFMERLAKGSLAKTIAENGHRMKVLLNHGKDVLGDQVLGKIRSLEDTARGGEYEVELFRGIPDLVLDGLRAGVYGASFRFSVLQEKFNRDAEPSDYNPQGLPERTIQEAKVSEFGPVTFPAYAGATAGVRSLTDKFALPEHLSEMLMEYRAAALDRKEPDPEPREKIPADVQITTPLKDEPPHSAEEVHEEREENPSWHLP